MPLLKAIGSGNRLKSNENINPRCFEGESMNEVMNVLVKFSFSKINLSTRYDINCSHLPEVGKLVIKGRYKARKVQQFSLIGKSLTYLTTKNMDPTSSEPDLGLLKINLGTIESSKDKDGKIVPSERRRGQLLHQCLPISSMKLFDGYLLVIAEGPCLLLSHPRLRRKQPNEKYKRFQIFPNQLTITGIHFIEDSCGYPARQSSWDGPDENHSLAFVWAGNHGVFITLNRTSLEITDKDVFPNNQDDSLGFSYIPIAARWFENGRILALLSVFNYVVVYERTSIEEGIKGLKEIAKYECEPENLYSGTMDGDELNDLLVFSGTTFKGILVWDIQDGKVNIRHKLTGHKGIPFSLEYNSDWQVLLSSADDRTVLIWGFFSEEEADETARKIVGMPAPGLDDGFLMYRKNQGKKKQIYSMVKRTHTLIGHEGRVWRAIWVKHGGFVFVASVGEDSCVRIRSYDRTFQKDWRAHEGASIYHCAYDQDDDLLYTAAHDGSVFQWKRFYLKTQPMILPFDRIPQDPRTEGMVSVNEHGRSLVNKDYPRCICLWDTNYIIACMDSGRIIAFYYHSKEQVHLFYHECFKRYGVLSVSRQRAITAVGGLNGDFVLLKMTLEKVSHSSDARLFAEKVWYHKFDSKVLNTIWLADDKENRALIICLDKAYLYSFYYTDEEKTKLMGGLIQTFVLTLERPGLPTAILKDSKYIIAGDEVGSLLVFRIDISEKNLIHSIKNVHNEGVTSIVEYKSKIMTAGRYGGVKSFVLEEEGSTVNLVQLHEFIPPFEWVGQLLPIRVRGEEDLLLAGFQKGDFIIYSWKDKRILNEIAYVGGGHRRWDFKYKEGIAAFTYIRDREIYYSTTSIDDRINNVLKPGLHYRTVNCGIELQKKETDSYIATGSEDGTVRIFRYNFSSNKYYPIHRINSHASSVRTLASIKLDDNRNLLFSAGGRSEVFAFLVGIGVDELTMCGKITIIKAKNRDTEIDTRIMNLNISKFTNRLGKQGIVCFCACSDGVIRSLYYSFEKKNFTIISLLQANNHAVMKTQVILLDNYFVVLGVTSNGNLIAWKWEAPEDLSLKLSREPEVLQPFFSKRIRNAAIMSFKISPLSDPYRYMIAFGGDDCSISVSKLEIPQNSSDLERDMKLDLIWSNDQTQRGSVIDVEIINDLIYCCSNDQVISRWDFDGNLLGKAYAGVSDCQGFVVNTQDDCITCFGDGITWITIP